MQAVILAGGHGTDLRLLTTACPKPLLPIAGRPALAYTLAALRDGGITDFAITVNGDGAHFRRLLDDGSDLGIDIRYFHEPVPLGTAGSLRAAASGNGHSPLLVVGSNLVMSVDLADLLRRHRSRGAIATVGLPPVGFPAARRTRRGMLRLAPDGLVHEARVAYQDGPEGIARPGGVYLLEPEALRHLPARAYFDLEEQLIPALVRAGLPVYASPLRGYLRELNSAEDYLAIQFDLLRGRAGAPPPGEEVAEGVWFQEEVDVAPDAVVIPPVHLGRGVRVAAGAVLVGPVALGAGSSVGRGAIVRESAVGRHACVEDGARLERCIVADHVTVAAAASMTSSVVAAGGLAPAELNLVERDLRVGIASLSAERYLASLVRRRTFCAVKRAFDIAFALAGLVLLLPLMLAVGVAVALDSRGPILFRQKRLGKGGRPFQMLKFRSMREDAERMQEALREWNEADGPVFKITDDPRFTRVGRWLRKYSLDELPQLWNVLTGAMSVVGPRPLAERELRLCPGWRDARLRVKPGLTGLWQVRARSRSAFHEWILHDLRYVKEQSLLLDLKILFRTFGVLSKGM